MANTVKISALAAASTLAGTEKIPTVQSGATVYTTPSSVLFQLGATAFLNGMLIKSILVVDAGLGTRLTLDGATGAIFVASSTDTSSNAKLSSTGTGGTAQAQMNLGGSLAVTKAFGANAATPQTAAAVHAAVVTTATTQLTPYGFATQAQGDDIVTLLNQIRAALVANGICV